MTPATNLPRIATLALLCVGALALWAGFATGGERRSAAAPAAPAAGGQRVGHASLLEVPSGDSSPSVVDAMAQGPERAAVDVPPKTREELLAARLVRVRVETPSGTPIPGLVLRNGGSSWGDNFDFMTDAAGEVTVRRPAWRTGFEHLKRRLPFDEQRRFPLSEARLEGELFVLTMDDVGMVRIEPMVPAGTAVPDELKLELLGELGQASLAELESSTQAVGEPRSGSFGRVPPGSSKVSLRVRTAVQGPILLPVLRGVHRVRWWTAAGFRGSQEGWQPLADPGSVEVPVTWYLEVQATG